jgi:hypothetical protein
MDVVGITLINSAYHRRWPTPIQAKALLKNKNFRAWYEPAALTYRLGDEHQLKLGDDITAVIVEWDGGCFWFRTYDEHNRDADLIRWARRKLKSIAADDHHAYDSLHGDIGF